MVDVARIEETTRGGVEGRTVLMGVVPDGRGWTERSRVVIILSCPRRSCREGGCCEILGHDRTKDGPVRS